MRMERSKVKRSGDCEYLQKKLGVTIFQGSDCAEGSDDGEVGFGGVDSALGKA